MSDPKTYHLDSVHPDLDRKAVLVHENHPVEEGDTVVLYCGSETRCRTVENVYPCQIGDLTGWDLRNLGYETADDLRASFRDVLAGAGDTTPVTLDTEILFVELDDTAADDGENTSDKPADHDWVPFRLGGTHSALDIRVCVKADNASDPVLDTLNRVFGPGPNNYFSGRVCRRTGTVELLPNVG